MDIISENVAAEELLVYEKNTRYFILWRNIKKIIKPTIKKSVDLQLELILFVYSFILMFFLIVNKAGHKNVF